MTREQAKELLPIIQAFADGKTIQHRNKGRSTWHNTTTWYDLDWDELNIDCNMYHYRIKPEPKFRPFKNIVECWQEMQKHQPFGWVVEPATNHYKDISILLEYNTMFHDDIIFKINFNIMFKNYKFTDGTPFGIKEE